MKMNKMILENPKIILIVQGRIGSSRLPKKALYPLGKKTVLHQVLKNLKSVDVKDYFLATDYNSEEFFAPIAKECGFKLFSGPENDVLERFCLLIKQENPDVVVRATGDNPFLFTDAANFSIKRFLELNATSKVDYFTISGLPHGSGIEIFLGKSLLEAAEKTNLPYDHEHVGPALYNHPENFVSVFEPAPEKWNFPKFRTTIDTFFDYKKAEKLYKILDCENQPNINSEKLIEACNLDFIKYPILFMPNTQKGKGTGHFRRCLSLAEELNGFLFLDFNNKTELPDHFENLLENSNLWDENLIFGKENLKKLAENQNEKPFSLVVLDSFVTPKEKADFASKLGKVLSLDDGQENPEILGKINYLLDIIPSSKLKRSPNWKNTDFIPKPKNKKTEKVSQIKTGLISIGGEDPAGFSNLAKIALGKLGVKTTTVDVENPIPNLKEELYKYDLILTHYGFTAFEAKAAGAKVILVATTKLHKSLAKSEGFICLEKKDFKNKNKLKEIIKTLETENSKNQSDIKSQIDIEESSKNEASLKDFILDFSKTKEHFCPVCNSSNNLDKVIFRKETRTVKKCSKCHTIYLNIEKTPISDYSESYFFEDYKNQYGKTYLEDFESIKNQGLRRAKIMWKLATHTVPAFSGENAQENCVQAPSKGSCFSAQKSSLENCVQAPSKETCFLTQENSSKEKRNLSPQTAPALLDIGCAYGPFLAAAKETGFASFGTDISKSATDYVSEKLGFSAFHGDFTTTDFQKQFDAVSMWYVIEHFENLDTVLNKVNSLLKNKGIFAFSTPSASGVSGRFKTNNFLQNSPVDHYSIWSFKSAKKVLKKYGFKILKIQSTGHHPERFFKKSISKEKNPFLWNLILQISRIFKLGDTFEVYCKKISSNPKTKN